MKKLLCSRSLKWEWVSVWCVSWEYVVSLDRGKADWARLWQHRNSGSSKCGQTKTLCGHHADVLLELTEGLTKSWWSLWNSFGGLKGQGELVLRRYPTLQEVGTIFQRLLNCLSLFESLEIWYYQRGGKMAYALRSRYSWELLQMLWFFSPCKYTPRERCYMYLRWEQDMYVLAGVGQKLRCR